MKIRYCVCNKLTTFPLIPLPIIEAMYYLENYFALAEIYGFPLIPLPIIEAISDLRDGLSGDLRFH